MIDRRFISSSLVVNGVVNALPSNPTTGVQYLVQCDFSGDDLYEYNNYIIRYDGSAWEYIPPRLDILEIINSQTGEILHWDGSAWKVVAKFGFLDVDYILDFNYTDSSDNSKFNNIAGVSFVSMNDSGNYDSAGIYFSLGNATDTCRKSISTQNIVIAFNSNGKIYSYNGDEWDEGVTPLDSIVIRLKSTGEIFRYNGSKWSPIGSGCVIFVDNIVNFNYTGNSDDSKANVKGAKFISVNSRGSYYNSKYYVSNGDGTNNEYDIATNSLFAVKENGFILSYDGSEWTPYLVPSEGCFIVSKADRSMYYKDGSTKAFVAVGGGGASGSSGSLTNEVFTLTSSHINSKSLTLSGSIASGTENSVICFVGGSVHFAGTDFTASGDSISWNGKNLDSVGLKVGDTIIVQYLNG